MTTKVAINGFGRIGRLALREILAGDYDIEVVAINDLTDNADLAYLYKYDTAFGRADQTVELGDEAIILDGKAIKAFEEKDASKLPWGELGIDVVLECTGFYNNAEKAQAHIDAGAKKVIISAPAKDKTTKQVVYGVNDDIINADDVIVSAASCTTNCLAPMVKVLNDNFGLEQGVMSTIHAYTATQSLQDAPGGRKSRAGAANIIPAATGAAKAVGKVIPEVNGKIDGSALRVPTITGSVVELYTNLSKEVTVEEINAAMKAAASESFGYTEDEIVSSDVIGDTHNSVFDATQTKIVEADGGQLVKTVAFYDNEYGFTANMIRLLNHINSL